MDTEMSQKKSRFTPFLRQVSKQCTKKLLRRLFTIFSVRFKCVERVDMWIRAWQLKKQFSGKTIFI